MMSRGEFPITPVEPTDDRLPAREPCPQCNDSGATCDMCGRGYMEDGDGSEWGTPTQECDQCGFKADETWTHWGCPRGSYPGDCDGKMQPLRPMLEAVQKHVAWLREQGQEREVTMTSVFMIVLADEVERLKLENEQLKATGAAQAKTNGELAQWIEELRGTPCAQTAAVDAFDAIAKACGCPEWDYPGQVVRDVEALKAQLAAVQELQAHCAKEARALGIMRSLTATAAAGAYQEVARAIDRILNPE